MTSVTVQSFSGNIVVEDLEINALNEQYGSNIFVKIKVSKRH